MSDWRQEAACRGMDPLIFYPRRLGNGERHRDTPEDYPDAIPVCARCPVREQCDMAGAHERQGMWGGRTENERRQARALRIAS